MAVTIRISGVDIDRRNGSVRINDRYEQRSTARFIVVDTAGIATYAKGQAVEIFEGLAIPPFIHPLFSGFIDTPRKTRISPKDNGLYWIIDCVDNHYLADKRIAAESYVAQTAGFIVTDLWTNYLAPEGVTLGTIDAGPTIAEMIINYRRVSDALDMLAARSDKIWYINKFKELHFIDRTTVTAPFAIVASDILRYSGPPSELAEAAPQYRNRQYIRGGKDVTVLQTETFTGDGDTVAFPVGYPIAKEPTITLDDGFGPVAQDVGIKGIDTAKDVYWNKGDAIVTFAVAPGIGDIVVVVYYGFFDILVMADLLGEQVARQAVEGGTGIIEAMDDEPSIQDTDDALGVALAKLNYYGVIGKQFQFAINKWGLEPGQLVAVTHTPYGLAGDELLVESVQTTEIAPGELCYEIHAVQGPEMGDWTGFFKSLADMKEEVLERITVGTDSILIILVHQVGNVEISGVVTCDVVACPVPSLTLYPSVTLYPC